MPWNLSSCSESSLNAGVSSTSSSLMSPRRWLLLALMDSLLEKPSKEPPSERLDKLDTPPLLGLPGAENASCQRAWKQGREDPLERSASYRSSWRSGRSRWLDAE